ncbi:uncharacterized protein A4U43_C07F20270 [Asparagus officinalis]|uniref:Uncharacterized protein n=1 Tax=Asparagus officinalis TaxID=4686 RepID=A0A5P1EGG5_ASPOF|nr:uncharacterized protein A4U43_C07F20270 [Asparagus officinalis]
MKLDVLRSSNSVRNIGFKGSFSNLDVVFVSTSLIPVEKNVDGSRPPSLRYDPIIEPILNVDGSYPGKSDPARSHRSIPRIVVSNLDSATVSFEENEPVDDKDSENVVRLSGKGGITLASMAQVELNNVVHNEENAQEVLGASEVNNVHNQGCSEVHHRNLDQAGCDTHSPTVEYVENNISVDNGANQLKMFSARDNFPGSELVHMGHVLNSRNKSGDVNIRNLNAG